MREFGAYVHARPGVDGQIFYVGKGRKKRARSLKARNPYHGSVVVKHGAENVGVGFIPCSSEAIAFELEIGLIKILLRNGVKLTNMMDGGKGGSTGRVFTAETRAKISEAARVNGTGKTHSVKTKAKIAKAARGKTHTTSEETKIKLRAASNTYWAARKAVNKGTQE
jgi:hypothetical protein